VFGHLRGISWGLPAPKKTAAVEIMRRGGWFICIGEIQRYKGRQ